MDCLHPLPVCSISASCTLKHWSSLTGELNARQAPLDSVGGIKLETAQCVPVAARAHAPDRSARQAQLLCPPPGFCDDLFFWTLPSPATSQVLVGPFVQSCQYLKCSDPDVCRNKCWRRFQFGSTHRDRTYMRVGCAYNRFASAACLFSSCSESFRWRTSFPCLFCLEHSVSVYMFSSCEVMQAKSSGALM